MNSKRNSEWLEGTNALTMWYYLYQRSKGDPVTHMCYATYEWSKKEHGTCTSQGLGSPCHRCQLDLIAVIRECCEWEHYCEWETMEESTGWACPETEGIHLACCHTGSNSVSHSLTALYWHRCALALTDTTYGRWTAFKEYIYGQVCFFSNYPAHNYCCLGAYAWIDWLKSGSTSS